MSEERVPSSGPRISAAFNALLVGYMVVKFTLALFVFRPVRDAATYWDYLFAGHDALSISLLLVLGGALLVAAAFLVREVWNRMIADVFRVRGIVFQESLALVLLAATLVGA